MTKALYSEAGLNADEAGTHCWRISGATALFAMGSGDTVIRTMGRWSSDLYRLYVRSCFEQCRAWTSRAGSADFTTFATVFDEVEDY